MTMTTKELREQGDHLFGKKMQLLNLQQEIAENFYPERADFTVQRYLGTEFAGNLMTSYPILCRRDLGDSIGTMLRDMRKPWFEMVTTDQRREDNDAKRWMQWATNTQRRAMYDPVAHFQKAAKQGDHDFAAFGDSVISVRLNQNANALAYKCHHLRDLVWLEDADGNIVLIIRRWKPYAFNLVDQFKASALRPNNSVHPNVLRLVKGRNAKPFEEISCMHIMARADMCDGYKPGKNAKPWCSIYYDCDNQHEMEKLEVWNKEYVISRWQLVSGSQYAYSPAVVAGLPDARLLQSMTYTLLTAGEKIVNPSMIAVEQAVRSDVDLSSGGITWVDFEYDHRTGAPLQPLQTDAKGMPIGRDMQADCRAMLSQCFYLNKIKPFVPSTDPNMTAYQAGQIVAQYIRDALPLFEPMEAECNGGICEESFQVLMRAGAFGRPEDMPEQLHGADFRWRFQSPLHDAIEAQKGTKFLEMSQIIAQAMALDKSAATLPDTVTALRDALDGIQVPAKWIFSEAKVKEMQDAAKRQQAAAQGIEAMQGGADVAATLAGAMKDNSAAAPQQVAA